MKRLSIDLADRSYDILIGRNLLTRTGELLSKRLNPSRVAIVTHPSIRSLFGEKIESSLAVGGHAPEFIEVPEGESSKSLKQAESVYDRLLEMHCDRGSALVALGGGVVGDLTGFIAATYQRGIPFVQIPTTLLSQVDSSVGGKTAVNHPRGKNMIGAFYQPRMVVIDLETLRTLPSNEFKAGLAEVVKYGVIADAGLFAFLEANAERILSLDSDCLERIIETSCAIKARVVEKDERESRHRMVLNFGHTFGHAIETLTGYTGFLHGEAVAIGMVQAARLSVETGRCSAEVPRRIASLLNKLGLPTRPPDLKTDDIVESMYHDKKTAHKQLRFVLVKEIGSIEIVDDVPETPIRSTLDRRE
ncbi:3-dehydroquinate synthase [Candidatus Nitromaritima sp. SCGC AAA799-A02]|nr:3-dehydroquinate synthase [Candidatus Nitromaritima sp. SCGC AAA799-A02]